MYVQVALLALAAFPAASTSSKSSVEGTTRLSEETVNAIARSTEICFFRNLRAAAKQEIETEKRYARRGGGVVDLDKVYRLQAEVRTADESLSRLRATGNSLRCSDQRVAESSLCYASRRMGTYPDGSDAEVIRRFCRSPDLEALMSSIDLGSSNFVYGERAEDAMLASAYELDRAWLVARSAEICSEAQLRLMVGAKKLERASRATRAEFEKKVTAVSRPALEELSRLEVPQLACDDPGVRSVLTCILVSDDDKGVKTGCNTGEVRESIERLRRP